MGTVTVPLMYNEVIKQQPVNFVGLEKSYSDFANGFIATSAKKRQPFFLYFPSHVREKSHYFTFGETNLLCFCRMGLEL